MDIQFLVRFLSENHVIRFEGYGIKVEFDASRARPACPEAASGAGVTFPELPKPQVPPAPSTQEQAAKAAGPELPPDLRPDTMDVDKIALWSASPSPDEPQGESLPLTGDAPLPG